MIKVLTYIENKKPNNRLLYLNCLFEAISLVTSFKTKEPDINQKAFVDMIQSSEELKEIFIECRGQAYLDKITSFVNTLNSTNQENTSSIQEIHCPTFFSTEQNP